MSVRHSSHRRAQAALSAEIGAHDGTLPLVVVTHHAPHPDCIAPAQCGTWSAGSSASDLSALTDSGRAALWRAERGKYAKQR